MSGTTKKKEEKSQKEIIQIKEEHTEKITSKKGMEALKRRVLRGEFQIETPKASTVTEKDLNRLMNNQWLSDNVINFYTPYLVSKTLPVEMSSLVHVYDTFFYTGLITGMIQYRKSHFDVFKKRLIIIPINQGSDHWAMLFLFNPGNASLEEVDQEAIPYVLVADSYYEPPDPRMAAKIKQYLTKLWMVKYEGISKKEAKQLFNDQRFRVEVFNGPMQDNTVDCGIYAFKNVEYILTNIESFLWAPPPKTFRKIYKQEDMAQERNRIGEQIREIKMKEEEEEKAMERMTALINTMQSMELEDNDDLQAAENTGRDKQQLSLIHI